MKTCAACGRSFRARVVIAGKLQTLYSRKFCLACSPFGAHNTSKVPPTVDPDMRARIRRESRRDSYLRYQRARRLARKRRLVAGRGGRCERCGYSGALEALDFHHRDAKTKLFRISGFNGSNQRLADEAAKCDLLCANCHRLRHAVAATHVIARFRADLKRRAVAQLGGRCVSCDFVGVSGQFDLHHVDPSVKDFALADGGLIRSWARVSDELSKCVLLCANCHREVHAGVRELGDKASFAEDVAAYVA